MDGEEFQIFNCATGQKWNRVFKDQPIVKMFLEGAPQECLLDTGSEYTILNPVEGCDDTSDPIFSMFKYEEARPIGIRGNRGLMTARRAVQFTLGWSPFRRQGFYLPPIFRDFHE